MGFKIELENKYKDITPQINSRLLNLVFTDNKANTTDTLEFKLENHNFMIEPPPVGTKLNLWIDNTYCGLFHTDEEKLSLKPSTLTITAKSADFKDNLKQKKNRNLGNTYFLEIVKTIAKDAGMDCSVHNALAMIPFNNFIQNNESDLHFLTRMSRRYGGLFKIHGNKIVITTNASTASGEQMPIITLNALSDIATGDLTSADRNKYKSTVAYFKTENMDKKQAVRVGEGQPIFFIKEVESNEQLAKKAAQTKFEQLNATSIFGNIKTTKRFVEIKAGAKIKIVNLNKKFDGLWLVEKARHELGSNNYSNLEISKI